jgi:hypothetical protein
MTSDAIATGTLAQNQLPMWMTWTGRALSALAILDMVASASLKLSGQAAMYESVTHRLGYPAGVLPVLAIIELVSVVLYAIPRTTVLGTIVLTAYLGGAVASHVRIGESFLIPVGVGILAWVGLFLRKPEVRAVLFPALRPR